ncbi:hypothetical protein BN439_3556 [Erwinia amylovora Ea644]|nr:hypothetical protein BN439_3556 [Erwinia amylovora Ea644]CCP08643.1 hypothetical protein BN440_3653 [Erwinia amylovora MR1]
MMSQSPVVCGRTGLASGHEVVAGISAADPRTGI